VAPLRRRGTDAFADHRSENRAAAHAAAAPDAIGSSSGKKGGPVATSICRSCSSPRRTGPGARVRLEACWAAATATRCVLRDDFAPLLVDEDALDHERLWHKLYKRLQSVGRHGLVTQARRPSIWRCGHQGENRRSAGVQAPGRPPRKRAGLRLGRRWLYMSVPEMVAAFEGYLAQGMMASR